MCSSLIIKYIIFKRNLQRGMEGEGVKHEKEYKLHVGQKKKKSVRIRNGNIIIKIISRRCNSTSVANEHNDDDTMCLLFADQKKKWKIIIIILLWQFFAARSLAIFPQYNIGTPFSCHLFFIFTIRLQLFFQICCSDHQHQAWCTVDDFV